MSEFQTFQTTDPVSADTMNTRVTTPGNNHINNDVDDQSPPHGAPRHNLAASGAPTVNDDEADGYGNGSIWVHSGTFYICTDGATGAAVWQEYALEDHNHDSDYNNYSLETHNNDHHNPNFAEEGHNHDSDYVEVAGDTLTGNLNFDGNEAQNAKIVGADIQSYVEEPVTSTGTGAQTLDLNAGTLFEHTVNADTETTFSLDNVALGKSFTLVVHQHEDGPTITLDWTILWSGDSVPEMVDGETNVFTFMRIAAGTGTWLGHHVGDTYGDGAE